MGMLRKGLMVAVLAVTVVAVAVPAQALSLTTFFASDNQFDGNMFDVTVFASDITITSLEVSIAAGQPLTTIEVYIKTGTFGGFQTNPAAWTLVSSTAGILSAGLDVPTFVDVTDFALSSSTLYGMYVTTTGAAMRYTNGDNIAINADLQLDLGEGLDYPFGPGVVANRTWNGTINYQLGAADPIPEPGTLALFGFGLAAGAGKLRRKFGKKS